MSSSSTFQSASNGPSQITSYFFLNASAWRNSAKRSRCSSLISSTSTPNSRKWEARGSAYLFMPINKQAALLIQLRHAVQNRCVSLGHGFQVNRAGSRQIPAPLACGGTNCIHAYAGDVGDGPIQDVNGLALVGTHRGLDRLGVDLPSGEVQDLAMHVEGDFKPMIVYRPTPGCGGSVPPPAARLDP